MVGCEFPDDSELFTPSSSSARSITSFLGFLAVVFPLEAATATRLVAVVGLGAELLAGETAFPPLAANSFEV